MLRRIARKKTPLEMMMMSRTNGNCSVFLQVVGSSWLTVLYQGQADLQYWLCRYAISLKAPTALFHSDQDRGELDTQQLLL